ncbi:cytochrome b561 and DOMON domain-containing protein At5g47530-like [Abrus precatorius]|uniref:Cytochrome b561 and DOMON domain-containing protein At5g47530-like n=1 Tax=Abrus precatorius TaxID=3816 RepID=A0A8B8KBJ5_ABRPR|nr:cytochrome b561 and DOMON domain-containing protein At5g47530-like [Abrus precatorius]
MAFIQNPLLLLLTLFTVITVPATSQPCTLYPFPNHVNYAACEDLAKANAKGSSWIAWAINPTSKGMVGSQTFVAIHKSDGTIKAYASPITSYETMLQEGNLTFPVYSVSASHTNGSIIIFASFQLPTNKTLVNHVWQEGLVSHDGTPRPHSLSGPNLQSFGTLDFVSGKVLETGGKMNTRTILRNVRKHQLYRIDLILFINSWGILMPIAVIFARFMRGFDGLGSTWFRLHRACQSLAFVVGIAGFGTGLYMGNHYGVRHAPHRCIGITLMCLAFAQVCVAVFLRPKKDHKNRIFWNIFHYMVGYATIALSIFNVLKGFDILNAHKIWKMTYVAIIIVLAIMAMISELITWIWVCKKKRNNKHAEHVDINQHQQP